MPTEQEGATGPFLASDGQARSTARGGSEKQSELACNTCKSNKHLRQRFAIHDWRIGVKQAREKLCITVFSNLHTRHLFGQLRCSGLVKEPIERTISWFHHMTGVCRIWILHHTPHSKSNLSVKQRPQKRKAAHHAHIATLTSRISCTTGAFPAPVHTNIAACARLSTGNVSVTRCGGGFGESTIDATSSDDSCNYKTGQRGAGRDGNGRAGRE